MATCQLTMALTGKAKPTVRALSVPLVLVTLADIVMQDEEET